MTSLRVLAGLFISFSHRRDFPYIGAHREHKLFWRGGGGRNSETHSKSTEIESLPQTQIF